VDPRLPEWEFDRGNVQACQSFQQGKMGRMIPVHITCFSFGAATEGDLENTGSRKSISG
jgi:hypothetical protein